MKEKESATRSKKNLSTALKAQTPNESAVVPDESSDSASAPSPHEDIIRQRAFELYEARNGNDGSAMDDWLQAERIFQQESGVGLIEV